MWLLAHSQFCLQQPFRQHKLQVYCLFCIVNNSLVLLPPVGTQQGCGSKYSRLSFWLTVRVCVASSVKHHTVVCKAAQMPCLPYIRPVLHAGPNIICLICLRVAGLLLKPWPTRTIIRMHCFGLVQKDLSIQAVCIFILFTNQTIRIKSSDQLSGAWGCHIDSL